MKYLILGLGLGLLTTTASYSSEKSICGETDDRVLSLENEVGRSSNSIGLIGCTATMISDDCAISAGHCVDVLTKVSFNVPESVDTIPRGSEQRDIYQLDKESLIWADNGEGDDWAVFKLKKNTVTGKLPGVVQGHLDVDLGNPRVKGKNIRITGFGADKADPIRNFAQQTHSGKVKRVGGWGSKSKITYTVDTMGGNSGSSLVLESSNKIIGIHTNGGCGTWGNTNSGTIISKNQKLKDAIKSCLAK